MNGAARIRPSGVLYERMQRLSFAAHNYGSPVIGIRSDIESVPIETLQALRGVAQSYGQHSC